MTLMRSDEKPTERDRQRIKREKKSFRSLTRRRSKEEETEKKSQP